MPEDCCCIKAEKAQKLTTEVYFDIIYKYI